MLLYIAAERCYRVMCYPQLPGYRIQIVSGSTRWVSIELLSKDASWLAFYGFERVWHSFDETHSEWRGRPALVPIWITGNEIHGVLYVNRRATLRTPGRSARLPHSAHAQHHDA